VQPFPVPSRRFSHVHIDLVGLLLAAADGSNHILTMIDRSARGLGTAPLRDTSRAS